MDATRSGAATVAVVDDERALADLYATWLGNSYDVRVAYDGPGALETIDDGVDVVILDRHMPDPSGTEVLAEIRRRGVECPVAMVTGVEPDVDIVEMEFDDYLCKPVTRDEIEAVVERLLRRASYQDLLQEQFALARKKAVLEAAHASVGLADSEEYAALESRLEAVEAELAVTVEQFAEADFVTAFHAI